MPPSSAQNSGGASATRGGNLSPEGPHETAPSLGRRQQRREGGCRRHVVDRAGVDAPDEGIHQPVDHPPPQLVGHQWAHRPVADGPAQVGPGQEGVPGQAGHAAQSEDARTRRRPEPGRDAQRQPFGERANPPTRPDPGPPAADGHERFAESDRVAEIERFGSATEKSIRAEIDHGAPERLTVQGAAQSGRCFDQGDPGRPGPRAGVAARQLPGRHQPADPSADHRDACARASLQSHRAAAVQTTSARTPMKALSSLSDAVRAKRRPVRRATSASSISMS